MAGNVCGLCCRAFRLEDTINPGALDLYNFLAQGDGFLSLPLTDLGFQPFAANGAGDADLQLLLDQLCRLGFTEWLVAELFQQGFQAQSLSTHAAQGLVCLVIVNFGHDQEAALLHRPAIVK